MAAVVIPAMVAMVPKVVAALIVPVARTFVVALGAWAIVAGLGLSLGHTAAYACARCATHTGSQDGTRAATDGLAYRCTRRTAYCAANDGTAAA